MGKNNCPYFKKICEIYFCSSLGYNLLKKPALGMLCVSLCNCKMNSRCHSTYLLPLQRQPVSPSVTDADRHFRYDMTNLYRSALLLMATATVTLKNCVRSQSSGWLFRARMNSECNFQSCTVHLHVNKVFYIPTDAQ